MVSGISGDGPISYSATLRGSGNLNITDRVADRVALDSWHVPNHEDLMIIMDDPRRDNNIGGFKIIKDDNTVTTPATRKKQRTKTKTERTTGFRIIKTKE
jgi:hypothetical protein